MIQFINAKEKTELLKQKREKVNDRLNEILRYISFDNVISHKEKEMEISFHSWDDESDFEELEILRSFDYELLNGLKERKVISSWESDVKQDWSTDDGSHFQNTEKITILLIPDIFKEYYTSCDGDFFKIDNKIILKIDKENKTITKDLSNKNLICTFRKGTAKNKRFEYIIILAKSNKKIGAKKLSKTTYQNISTEIDSINERLKDSLGLTKKVIKNDNNSGYEIDWEIYKITFV
ncbi:MAG: hypothetical protein NTU76_03585 [Candidatus Taylorbacteria bacterium]|nr:hypothetical protein [Candidatus Taylorbacteria bacterium]